MPKTNRKRRVINKNTLKKRIKNKNVKRGGSLMPFNNTSSEVLSLALTSVFTNTDTIKEALSTIEFLPNINIDRFLVNKFTSLITPKNIAAVGGCVLGLGIIGGIAGYTGLKTYDGIKYAENYLRNINLDTKTSEGLETCNALYKMTSHTNSLLGEIICGSEGIPKELIELFENMKNNQKKLETFICSLKKT